MSVEINRVSDKSTIREKYWGLDFDCRIPCILGRKEIKNEQIEITHSFMFHLSILILWHLAKVIKTEYHVRRRKCNSTTFLPFSKLCLPLYNITTKTPRQAGFYLVYGGFYKESKVKTVLGISTCGWQYNTTKKYSWWKCYVVQKTIECLQSALRTEIPTLTEM